MLDLLLFTFILFNCCEILWIHANMLESLHVLAKVLLSKVM